MESGQACNPRLPRWELRQSCRLVVPSQALRYPTCFLAGMHFVVASLHMEMVLASAYVSKNISMGGDAAAHNPRLHTDYYRAPPIGLIQGPFSSGFEQICPMGSFVTTLGGRGGAWVDRFVHARCSDGSGLAMEDGIGGDGDYWDGSVSGYTGVGFNVGIEVGVSFVHDLFVTRASGDTVLLAAKWSAPGPNVLRVSCPAGAIIAGFYGTASAPLVDQGWRLTSLGIICGAKNASARGAHCRWHQIS